MKLLLHTLLIAFVLIGLYISPSYSSDLSSAKDTQAQEVADSAGIDDAALMNDDGDYLEGEELQIYDPLEPINRFFFNVNDRLYFLLLKPIATGYADIVPVKVRVSMQNFFDNVNSPVRIVNNMLQMKMDSAGDELVRFGVNSTVGVLGLFDYAKSEMDIPMQEEDFGQTLGVWGIGPICYINWPVMGPSSLRDTIGQTGDFFLDPISYINPFVDRLAIRVGDAINRTSLSLGDYEALKEDAIDPYTVIRDIYFQYRENKVER
ncbi:MAG: VacJ family lipoprotein [Nitrospira sp.]|nr:VacJ family lipoprotein [Nitrospira sp.]